MITILIQEGLKKNSLIFILLVSILYNRGDGPEFEQAVRLAEYLIKIDRNLRLKDPYQ